MQLSDHRPLDPRYLLKALEHQVDQLVVDSYRLVIGIETGKQEIERGIEIVKGREKGIGNQSRRGLHLE
jgi:hypothetical protein